MVVAQDWGDVRYYEKNRGLDDLRNPTMRNLETILRHIGVNVSTTTYSEQNRSVFLTNAILCLKKDGLQAMLDPSWVQNCGQLYLRRQVDIVRPKVVVGLGKVAFHALLQAFNLPLISLSAGVAEPRGKALSDSTRLFAAYHCGARTTNINRSLAEQCVDWERIRDALR